MAAAADTANEPDPHWARHTITPPTRRYAGWPSPSVTTSRSCWWQCTSSANAGYEGLPHGPTSVAGLRPVRGPLRRKPFPAPATRRWRWPAGWTPFRRGAAGV